MDKLLKLLCDNNNVITIRRVHAVLAENGIQVPPLNQSQFFFIIPINDQYSVSVCHPFDKRYFFDAGGAELSMFREGEYYGESLILFNDHEVVNTIRKIQRQSSRN